MAQLIHHPTRRTHDQYALVVFILASCLPLQLHASTPVNETAPEHCRKKVQCIPVDENLKCEGTIIGHSETTFALVQGTRNFTTGDVLRKLERWEGLKQVPKCWEAIVPLLCALYTPNCQDGMVELPGKDMCESTRHPCRIVEIEEGWPSFMDCTNESIYQSGCTQHNTFNEVELNETGGCELPLVATDNERSWYEHVEGCGVQCQNVLFTTGEHNKMHIFIAVLASLCLVLTFFTLATFIADWKNSSRYPAVILFYMNGCFFMASVGFLAQFPPNARHDIVCRSDDTMRIGEPSEGENLSCVIIFIIVYYFIMAGVFWFVILSYAWHVSFRALGTPVDALQGKTGYFHILSWVFPFIMIVVILACNQVDGDSLMGICFVGMVNHYFRFIFVLVPTLIAVVVSAIFLTNGVITLCHVDRDNPGLLSNKAAARIKGTIARIGVFAALNLMYVLITLACHVYVYANQEHWEDGLQEYLRCEADVKIGRDVDGESANFVDEEECFIRSKPSLGIMMLHIFSFFGAGITMSTWVWTPSSLAIWRRAWRKITRQPINEPQKLRKSKMIAKAFAKRKDQQKDGDEVEPMSLSFEPVSHDDAIGMKLDIPASTNSVENSSSVWGNNVPVRMLTRRGAAMPIASISNSSSPAPATPDSAIDTAFASRSRNLVRIQAVVEPLPPDVLDHLAKKRKPKSKRRRKRPVMMQGPSRMETPMPDDFSDDDNNCISLGDGGTLAGSSGIGTLNESILGSGPSVESGSRRVQLERLNSAMSTVGSRVPKLPAIETKKKVTHPVRFEIPGVSNLDDVL
ncbi:Smoothened-like [Holothuria leucospilota]|uniref:Protein smoothened n=1 Tax=Holothuria leucospilota TaxID=206669 RepID=A0A9Q0YGH6_HOLLE|nr:Smoothened-like [Holothuria leucospilota]